MKKAFFLLTAFALLALVQSQSAAAQSADLAPAERIERTEPVKRETKRSEALEARTEAAPVHHEVGTRKAPAPAAPSTAAAVHAADAVGVRSGAAPAATSSDAVGVRTTAVQGQHSSAQGQPDGRLQRAGTTQTRDASAVSQPAAPRP